MPSNNKPYQRRTTINGTKVSVEAHRAGTRGGVTGKWVVVEELDGFLDLGMLTIAEARRLGSALIEAADAIGRKRKAAQ